MIKFKVETDGKDVLDEFKEDSPTLEEASIIVFRLEQIKNYLLSKEFESKFEIKSGDFADEE